MKPMIATMEALPENMYKAAQNGFINATDLADYLVKKGLPFRTAYKLSGGIVAECMAKGWVLETMPLAEYRKFSPLFSTDVYSAIDLKVCASTRISEGGTSPESVEQQLRYVRRQLEKLV